MFIVILILIVSLVVWSKFSGTAAAMVAGIIMAIWITHALTKAKKEQKESKRKKSSNKSNDGLSDYINIDDSSD